MDRSDHPSWDDVRYFLAVARERRLTRAAGSLGVLHTTVARRIATLEERLGARLFYRTATGHLLTPRGERVLAHAERMEAGAMGLAERGPEGDAELVGRVRLALPESFSTYWLAPRIGELRAAHPRIDVELVTGIGPTDLSRGEAELAIRTPRPVRRELSAFRLATSSMALYASPDLPRPATWRIDADPPRADGMPLLVYSAQLESLQRSPWFRRVVDRADVRLTSNSTLTLIAAARAGLGVAVLARFIGAAAGLVPVGKRIVLRHDLWLVSHPEFRREPCVAAVAEFVKRHAKGLDDPPMVRRAR